MCVLLLKELLDGGGGAVGRSGTADEEDVKWWAITDSMLQQQNLVSMRSKQTDSLKMIIQERQSEWERTVTWTLNPPVMGFGPFPSSLMK